jgi:hypothetical protein
MAGFEPAASCSQSRRANQAAPHPVKPAEAYPVPLACGVLTAGWILRACGAEPSVSRPRPKREKVSYPPGGTAVTRA